MTGSPTPLAVGARIEHGLVLDAASIRAGANLVGDANPLHHDEAFAARTRYGGLIASGAHTSALLAGLVSKGFGVQTRDGSVGVEYNVRFRAPVRPGRPLRMEWAVVALEPRRSGTLARLDGRIVDTADGTPLLTATMAVLYFAQ